MIYQVFLTLLLAYECLTQEKTEKFNESILQKIDILTNEVQFLKRENSDKEIRIQVLEEKVNVFELESQIQKETIIKLSTNVDILQNQINKTVTDNLENYDIQDEHNQVYDGEFKQMKGLKSSE